MAKKMTSKKPCLLRRNKKLILFALGIGAAVGAAVILRQRNNEPIPTYTPPPTPSPRPTTAAPTTPAATSPTSAPAAKDDAGQAGSDEPTIGLSDVTSGSIADAAPALASEEAASTPIAAELDQLRKDNGLDGLVTPPSPGE